MAQIAVSYIVSKSINSLSTFLIQESAKLVGVRSQVEWIVEELKHMRAFMENIESRGYSEAEGSNQLVNEIRSVALEARDAIETFLEKSGKKRRTGVLYLLDRYDVGKELEEISKKISQISGRITEQTTNIGVTVETPPGPGETSATPALEKLDHILTQKLITLDEVIKLAEHVRDEDLGHTQNILSNLNSTGELSQRENLWLEEVKEVCNYAVDVTEKFIKERERKLKMGRLWQVLYLFERNNSEMEFMKQMDYICGQLGDALFRWSTFGAGGDDMGYTKGSRLGPVPHLSLIRLTMAKVPLFVINNALLPLLCVGILITVELLMFGPKLGTRERTPGTEVKEKKRSRQLMTFLYFDLVDAAIFVLFYVFPVEVMLFFQLGSILYAVIAWTVSLWRSSNENFKSTRRYLDLMDALFIETESQQDLSERQMVWMAQLMHVALNAKSLIAVYPMDGSLVSRLRFATDVNDLLNEILDVSDRKNIYGIPNIRGRKELASQGEIIVEHNDNPQPHAPAATSSYRHITGLKRKFQLINEEKQLMDALSRDVAHIGELDEISKLWVEQMNGIALETEYIIGICATELEHQSMLIYILRYPLRYLITDEINWIRNKIESASRRRNAYGLKQLQSRTESLSTVQILHSRTQPSLIVKESENVGFDEDAQVLITQLLSDEQPRCITSIVGIEGTGKTTLAKMIFENKVVEDHFDCLIWVPVPPSCTDQQLELLQEGIADDAVRQIMGGQRDRWTTLEYVLGTILPGTMYLIVVDGIETSLVLDKLKKTIPDRLTRCRLLLTSRNAKVAQQAGPRSFVLPLQLLDDENSCILFTKHFVQIQSNLTENEKNIVTRCGGLPSEIIKARNSHLNNDGQGQEHPNQDRNPWTETLNTINTNLPLYLRRCLFYFELFPADFGIPARRLIVLWVAEGLGHSGEDEEPPEQVAEKYLTELINLNMVQVAKRKHNGKVKTCRLPHALHEFLLIKANESRFPQGHNTTDSNAVPESPRIRQVADHFDRMDIWNKHIHRDATIDLATLGTHYKDVLSFLSFDPREGSKPGQDIFNFLKLCISNNCFLVLRVLDLEGVYKPKLPDNIARLSRLRYLGLRWTYLESLPSSISSLLKLQTLDLEHTYIQTLPSSIWKMELRHLFLSETYRSRFPPKPNRNNRLSDLQTLWGLFVDEETPVKGCLDKLVNIRKLGLACQSMSSHQEAMEAQLDAVAVWIMKLEYLQSLTLKSRDEEGRPWNLPFMDFENNMNLTDMYLLGTLSCLSMWYPFPPSLIELTLSHSKLKDDDMQRLKDLPSLQSLALLAESYTGKVFVCSSGSFRQLRLLKIWMLEQLEEWKIEQEALPSLRQLEIRSCRCMRMLPHGLEHVNTLLELKLTNMPMQINIDKHNIPPNCQVYRDNSE